MLAREITTSLKQLVLPTLLVLIMALILSAPVSVLAQGVEPNSDICSNLVDPNDPPAICTSDPGEDPVTGEDGITTTIAQTLVYVVGAVSVIMVIVGGFRYVISGGDSNGVQGAKNTIIYALVGLVIAVFAQVIVSFVLARL